MENTRPIVSVSEDADADFWLGLVVRPLVENGIVVEVTLEDGQEVVLMLRGAADKYTLVGVTDDGEAVSYPLDRVLNVTIL